MSGKLNCIDLFCGCGGLSKGFLDAGYNVLLGIDFDDAALKTFSLNHGNAKALKLDLFNHDNIKVITDYLEQTKESLDVLIGGPPCQGFSIAGPRDMNDKRNLLYLAMVKLAERTKPKAILLENVPGMVQTNDGIGAKRIVEDFAKIGYTMIPKLLYAPDYGIPQIRRRVFFVGLKDGESKFEFPEPTVKKENYVTCEQAIGDLPGLEGIYGDEIQQYPCEPQSDYQRLMRKNSTEIHNHIGTIHDEKTLKFLAMIPEGKNYKALPKEYEGIYKYHEALTRYHSKKPSLTINTCHRSHFHYKYLRIPTVRESARLQSFPDDFIIDMYKQSEYKQFGNFANVPIIQSITKELFKIK